METGARGELTNRAAVKKASKTVSVIPYGLESARSGIMLMCKTDCQWRTVMAKKRAKPTMHSAVQRDLKSPKYQMRVVEDKSKYRRSRDKTVRMEDFRKAA